MSFCSNCGAKLMEGVKYCSECGSAVIDCNNKNTIQNRQQYNGRIFKCPNCGEVLKSFTSNCPSCGIELRETDTTSAVKEFEIRLEEIEARKESEKPSGIFKQTISSMYVISKTDEQKISLIKNFSVPNNKEDILEFMISATSNVDVEIYGTFNPPPVGVKALAAAWNTKIKQVYAKAKNIFGTDFDFVRIQDLYDSLYLDIKKQKKKRAFKYILMLGCLCLSCVAFFVGFSNIGQREEEKQNSKLDAMIVNVQNALDSGEYKLALITADAIDYQGYNAEVEQKWDIQRKYWVNKTIEEASKNGVELEYTSSEDVDNANRNLTTSSTGEIKSRTNGENKKTSTTQEGK